MANRNIKLLNAVYSSVPAVELPIDGGGTATFTEISDTTATAADVANSKYIYNSSGQKVQGTLSFSTIHTGSSAPSSSLGVNGDIYIQV